MLGSSIVIETISAWHELHHPIPFHQQFRSTRRVSRLQRQSHSTWSRLTINPKPAIPCHSKYPTSTRHIAYASSRSQHIDTLFHSLRQLLRDPSTLILLAVGRVANETSDDDTDDNNIA
jgi:hypothetical protein